MKKFTFLLFIIVILLTSCAQSFVKPKISEPVLKTDIKVSILGITNVSQITNIPLDYALNIIKENVTQIDFSEYYQKEKQEYAGNITNFEFFLNAQEKISFIDLDFLITKTLERNLKKFIRSLGKYNPRLDELKIQNIDIIEKEIIEKFDTRLIKGYLYTNEITNLVFETNYYSLGEDTNKVKVEIVEKEVYVTELKLSNNFLSNYIVENNRWILKITNGIPFVEGTPSDFSIVVFYYLEPSGVINNYFTNFLVSLFVVVSNNFSSNFIVFKTNFDFYEFLSVDHRIFRGIKPFFYNYNAGGIIVDVLPRDYDIYVDDFYLGKGKTDLEIVSEGLHKVSISKNTFSLVDYVFVKKGMVNVYKKDITDSKNLDVCKLRIDSIPSNADLFVENEYIGKTPTNLFLPFGKYRISLSKDNLESYSYIDLTSSRETNILVYLRDFKDKTAYSILSGLTILLGATTLSSVFLYFWADSQERYYSFLHSKEGKPEYAQMKEYYYYFKDNMRTTSIVGTISTFVLWGISLGIESDKFAIRLNLPF